MTTGPRLVLVVVEVADVPRSARLYREGFGIDLHVDDHGGNDRWISGEHAAVSWTDGAFLHFALYAAKADGPSRLVQLGFDDDDLDARHDRAVAAGAAVVHGPRVEPWGATSRYRDFDGNIVSFTARAPSRVRSVGDDDAGDRRHARDVEQSPDGGGCSDDAHRSAERDDDVAGADDRGHERRVGEGEASGVEDDVHRAPADDVLEVLVQDAGGGEVDLSGQVDDGAVVGQGHLCDQALRFLHGSQSAPT
jgi:predicted enzyme related to lactoylglutathione lyase